MKKKIIWQLARKGENWSSHCKSSQLVTLTKPKSQYLALKVDLLSWPGPCGQLPTASSNLQGKIKIRLLHSISHCAWMESLSPVPNRLRVILAFCIACHWDGGQCCPFLSLAVISTEKTMQGKELRVPLHSIIAPIKSSLRNKKSQTPRVTCSWSSLSSSWHDKMLTAQ